MFNKSQYLGKDDLPTLINKTGMTRKKILSWFRVSRALSNIYEPEMADHEEMVILYRPVALNLLWLWPPSRESQHQYPSAQQQNV